MTLKDRVDSACQQIAKEMRQQAVEKKPITTKLRKKETVVHGPPGTFLKDSWPTTEEAAANIRKIMKLFRESLPTTEQVAANMNNFARQLKEFGNYEDDNSDSDTSSDVDSHGM